MAARVLEDQPPRVHPRLVGEHPGQEVRRVVGLHPRRLVRGDGERGGVGLAEAERGELGDLVPDQLGGRAVHPADLRPGQELGTDRLDLAVVGQMPADAVGLGQVVAAQGRQHLHHLLVVHDHAVRLPQCVPQQRMRERYRLHPMPPPKERRDHVRLHRAGPEQRDVDDQVAPLGGLELLQQLALAGRLDLETAERVGGPDQLERRRVAQRDLVQVDLARLRARDLVQRVPHRRQQPDAQHVELQQAEDLDVVLVGLDHPVALERTLERHAVGQVVARQHDARRVQREMPREPVQPFDDPEQQVELARVQVQPRQLGQVLHRLADVVRADVRERLGRDVDLALGQAERLAHLADGAARAVRVDHRHAGAPVVAVAGQDHVVDVLAPGRLHVDVDVGELVALRVDEPFEQQPVADRVHVGDPGQVADERSGRRAAARAPDAHGPDVVHDVGHGQEVGREAHRLDHGQLVIEAVADLTGGLHAALLDPPPAALGQHRSGAPPGRRRELREVHLPDADVERAPLGDVERCVAQSRPLGEQAPHRVRGLQPSLVVAPADVVRRQRNDLAHALEDVGQERVPGNQVAHGVRGHARQAGAVDQPDHPTDLVRRTRLPVVADLHEQVPAEGVPPRVQGCARRVGPSPHRQHARLGVGPQQADQPLGPFADLAGRERRVAPLAAHVRIGQQPAEVAVPARVLGQDDHRPVGRSHSFPQAHRQRRAEDRVHPLARAGRGEPRRPVQAVAVGHRHRRHAERHRLPHQVLGRERAVAQREVGTDVQVNEGGGHGHGSQKILKSDCSKFRYTSWTEGRRRTPWPRKSPSFEGKARSPFPPRSRDAARLEEGDAVQIEMTPDGILLRPRKSIDATQAWFWTPSWQAGERKATKDIEAGRVERYGSDREFLKSLE